MCIFINKINPLISQNSFKLHILKLIYNINIIIFHFYIKLIILNYFIIYKYNIEKYI